MYIYIKTKKAYEHTDVHDPATGVHTCIHVRAVPVLVKICTTPILLCVHPVSTLLKR